MTTAAEAGDGRVERRAVVRKLVEERAGFVAGQPLVVGKRRYRWSFGPMAMRLAARGRK